MKSASRRLFGRFIVLAATVAACAGAHAQEVKHIKLGHSFADSHPRAVAMKQFAANVAKATGGQVVVDVFGNATLGSEEKMLIATQSGVQELYLGAVAPLATRRKELQIFDFPFLFATDAEAAAVLDGPIGRKLLDGLGEVNLHGLVWAGGAFRNMSNSKRPLATMADMKGLKQAAVLKVAADTRSFERAEEIRQAADVVAQLKAKGMTVTEMPAAELDKIRAAVQPVIDKNAEVIGKDFVQSVYAELKRLRGAQR